MPEKPVTSVDAHPLLGSPENPAVPWWLAEAAAPRASVTIELPEPVLAQLLELQEQLGIAVSDLVTSYATRGATHAGLRRRRSLEDIEDHTRFTGWMPCGTALLRGGD